MKKLHLIAGVLLLLLTNTISYYLGSHDFYMLSEESSDIVYPYAYNTSEALKAEREYCNAWIELCHYYLYENNPHIYEWMTDEDIERERHNFWYDVVMESDYYQKIDSLNEGDWEDFYSDWIDVH